MKDGRTLVSDDAMFQHLGFVNMNAKTQRHIARYLSTTQATIRK
jgi:hypothetical protein